MGCWTQTEIAERVSTPDKFGHECPSHGAAIASQHRGLGAWVRRGTIWLALAALPGCAHAMGELAGTAAATAAPEAIHASLDTLDTAATRRQILDILGSPEVQTAAQLLMARLTDGALDALTSADRAKRITALSTGFVTTIAESVSQSLHTSLGPEIALMVSNSMDAALQQALSPENQARMASLVAAVLERSVITLAASVNSGLRPTMRTVLREDIGPALRDALRDKDTQQGLADTMRLLTRQAVLGMQDGFAEIDARTKAGSGPPTLMSRLQVLAADGSTLTRWIAVVLAILVALLAVWLFRTRTRVSHATKETARRESALLSLAQALKATEARPWSHELREVLDEALRDDEKAEYLHELWRKNKAVRLAPVGKSAPAAPTGSE